MSNTTDEEKVKENVNEGGTQRSADEFYKKYKDFKWENVEQYKNGPVGDENRKCRDLICCIIFIVFIAACVAVAILGFSEGHPRLLLYSYDEDGKACGYDEGYEDYPYIYFYNAVENVKNLDTNKINAICVKTCPSEESVTTLDCKHTKANTDCSITEDNYYQSKGFLERFCIPYDSDEEKFDPETETKVSVYDKETGETITKIIKKDKISSENGVDYIPIDSLNEKGSSSDASSKLINWSFFSVDKLATYMSDLNVTKWAILGSVGWGLVLILLVMLFLRCFAGVLVFVVLILILAGLIALTIFFKYKENTYIREGDENTKTIYKVFFWILLVVTIIYFIYILCMCNRIRLAVALVKVTGKYINTNCCILIIPFIFFIISVLWYAYWIALSIFLYATGEFDSSKSQVIASFNWTAKIRYAWWFHLLTLFYIDAVIAALGQFVYASSACIWYFTHEKGIEENYIRTSFKRAFRYHWGSLCFGALIIAIIRFIMCIFEYFKKKLEKTYGAKTETGKLMKCIICCIQCCLNCVARTMEFVNRHAYIQIALKGDSFCTAAAEGFGLIIRNLGRFSALTLLGSLFTYIIAGFITVGTAVIGYILITNVSYFSDKLNSPILPIICMGLIGFILGYVTMNVYGMSMDALMHSFLLDEELNKGSTKAYPELSKFMSDER